KLLFETLFEESTDGLMILENGKCIECNQAILNTLGVKNKNLLYGLLPSNISPELQPDGQKSSLKEKKMMRFALIHGSHNFDWVYIGRNGEDVWVDVTMTAITMDQQDIVYVSCRDISLRKKEEKKLLEEKEKLYRLAHNDALTGLPNRLFFIERLKQVISMAKRHRREVAILFIDLDRFKEINDSLGHAAGDKVLCEIATRIPGVIRKEDTLVRLGGDEFVILMENLFDKTDAAILAKKILDVLNEPIYVEEHILYVSGSIGISLYPENNGTIDNLINCADTAMYKAKAKGRNNFQFHSNDLTEIANERVGLEEKLRQSLNNDEFLVYYQPQINSENGELTGMEAFVRWNHKNTKIIPPSKFIAFAEETGFIVPLDQWVMKKAFTQMVQWYKMGYNPGILALNLSMKQLRREDFISGLKSMLKETGCKPEWVSLEVTENQIMPNLEKVFDTLTEIREMGIKIAIDDFGIGCSTLSKLKHIPIDKLKIDQTFIKNLPYNKDDSSIVKAAVLLSRNLNIDIIAKGVETEEQKRFLIETGCMHMQGYIYAKPMMASKMEEMFKIKCHNTNDL
ncbi:MAG: EAL domain-containing protein, partial [Flavobacteriaceae bacterium]|nr:EAL domain-containing protein [Flavobacteriaceae bacterium]